MTPSKSKPAQIGRSDRDFEGIVERWMESGQAPTVRWTPEPDDDHYVGVLR